MSYINIDEWNLENKRVTGLYIGSIPVSGIVILSRVKYGYRIAHYIKLDKPVTVHGSTYDHVVVDHDNIQQVEPA